MMYRSKAQVPVSDALSKAPRKFSWKEEGLG